MVKKYMFNKDLMKKIKKRNNIQKMMTKEELAEINKELEIVEEAHNKIKKSLNKIEKTCRNILRFDWTMTINDIPEYINKLTPEEAWKQGFKDGVNAVRELLWGLTENDSGNE